MEVGQLSVGRAATNDVAVPKDGRASRQHAVLERLSAGWCVRDLGSRNGTFVNGERIIRDRALRNGDEIRIGDTRLVFRADQLGDDEPMTLGPEPPPDLTPRERDVLLVLCRRPRGDAIFHEPASTRAIASELCVSEAAVKAHLLRLYDKFGITGEGERRRSLLANEAVRRSAVTLSELFQSPDDKG